MNIPLQNKQIHVIQFRHGCADLDRTNRRETLCKDCGTPLQTGEGVYRRAFLGNGFVCFNCLRAQLMACTYDLSFQDNDAGFCLRDEHTIVQCQTETPRQFTTTEVLKAIRREWQYDVLDNLQGPDFITPQRLEDALDSILAEG